MACRVALILALVVLVGGCARGGSNVPLAANHPANPNASESPITPPSSILAVSDGATTAPAEERAGARDDMGGMQHGSGGMKGMDHNMAGMKHDAPASQPATTQAAVLYTCPMHSEVVSPNPGNCPKCRMKLVVKRDAKTSNHAGHQ